MPLGDDAPPPRPRWIGGALAAFMALVVLGLLHVGWRILLPGATATPQARAEPAEGRVLVEGSDCMRCHGMERRYVGPSFRQIAERYRERADAPEYLARKIREGGSGEWGRALMPRHPQITEAQSLQMARWLLDLSPAPSAGEGS